MKTAICICTYKRPELLEQLLRSLQNIHLGELKRNEVHIMIVDNYPDGRTLAVCKRMEKIHPLDLIYIAENQPGEVNSRNRAVDEALRKRFDFISFIDDDDSPKLDWLANLVSAQRETGADIVCGAIPPVADPACPDWFKNSPLFEQQIEGSRSQYGLPKDMGIGNSLIRCKMLEKLKSQGAIFAKDLVPDWDFFIRATKSGATLIKAEGAIVHRSFGPQRATLKGYLLYAFQCGAMIPFLSKIHGTANQNAARRIKAFKKLGLSLIRLPLLFYSKTGLARSLFHLVKEIGVLYGYSGRKYRYQPESKKHT
jgi:glycosyltransferase involved in cell wall biosynthesis